MTVARILAVKGRDVVTVQPYRTLGEIADVLATKSIGAVVVADADGEVIGIVSERDVVRAIARNGAAALEQAASRHMSQDVVSTSADATIDHVMGLMTTRRFRHLPVIEHGRLAGIVSIGDVVKQHIEAIETEQEALRAYIATA
jgi:CBS domain-containing protein